MWTPTAEEIAYYKRVGNNEEATDEYMADMLPLLLDHINEECTTQQFTPQSLTANVKLFLAGAASFFSSATYGLKSESIDDVSFSYDFTTLPASLTGLLSKYGYGRSGNYARFHLL